MEVGWSVWKWVERVEWVERVAWVERVEVPEMVTTAKQLSGHI